MRLKPALLLLLICRPAAASGELRAGVKASVRLSDPLSLSVQEEFRARRPPLRAHALNTEVGATYRLDHGLRLLADGRVSVRDFDSGLSARYRVRAGLSWRYNFGSDEDWRLKLRGLGELGLPIGGSSLELTGRPRVDLIYRAWMIEPGLRVETFHTLGSEVALDRLRLGALAELDTEPISFEAGYYLELEQGDRNHVVLLSMKIGLDVR